MVIELCNRQGRQTQAHIASHAIFILCTGLHAFRPANVD